MFRCLFYALLSLSFTFPIHSKTAQDDPEYTVIPNKAKLPILTPSLAEAKTLKIRLRNGLEAYIVSDPKADKSSASLTVLVGSWDDPAEHPGLAHFTEHMLFLGTKKYPAESEYSRYISEHGGDLNAFTSNENTSYMFSVDNDAFKEALDRFSFFFKEPLFNPSGVSRELKAIDQEYAKSLDNDYMRELHVYKELSKNDHPNHAFSIGNLATLSSVSQDVLKDWYNQHYSANLMRLIVISPLPMDELVKMAVNDFKDVPNHNEKRNNLNEIFLSPDITQKIIYIEPVKNIRTLSILWELPAKFSAMKDAKPDRIICNILGDEGQGSLLAELKREHLAESLGCGSSYVGPNNLTIYIEIGLTDEGLKQLNTVIERVFQTIAVLKQKGIPKYLFDEIQRMDTLRYQYQPREDAFAYLAGLAPKLAHEDMETFPEQTKIIQKFDPEAIQAILEYMTPQNMHADIKAPQSLTGISPDRKEKWMGVPYSLIAITSEQLAAWSATRPNPNIYVSKPNPFIPRDLSLVKENFNKFKDSTIPHPELIVNENGGKFFFTNNTNFHTPEICWYIEIETPEINSGDPLKVVLGDLYVKFLREALKNTAYAATIAGLNYEIHLVDNGIQIILDGYNDKAYLLLSEILGKLKSVAPSQQLFKDIRATTLRDYQNAERESPVTQAIKMAKSIIYKYYATEKQKALAMRRATYKLFNEFSKKIFNQAYVQSMLIGNMTTDEAKKVSQEILKALNSEPYPEDKRLKTEILVLNDQTEPLLFQENIPAEGNATFLVLQSPDYSLKRRAAQQVLAQAMGEAFFTELRTKQQTGYLVFSNADELERVLFNYLADQSNTHVPRALLARFELFLERYVQELRTDMPEERFNVIRNARAENLRQSLKSTRILAEYLNMIAFKYDADFDWLDKRLEGFAQLTYEEFIQYTTELIGKDNKRRFALLLRGNISLFQYKEALSTFQIRNDGVYVTHE